MTGTVFAISATRYVSKIFWTAQNFGCLMWGLLHLTTLLPLATTYYNYLPPTDYY